MASSSETRRYNDLQLRETPRMSVDMISYAVEHSKTKRYAGTEKLLVQVLSWNSYLPLDEFPPFLLSCSASKTSRATVRDAMLKSTFSQEHINIIICVKKHLPAEANR